MKGCGCGPDMKCGGVYMIICLGAAVLFCALMLLLFTGIL